jgi:hypothetical protein
MPHYQKPLRPRITIVLCGDVVKCAGCSGGGDAAWSRIVEVLHQTSFGLAMGGGVPWLWPLFKVLHFAGMWRCSWDAGRAQSDAGHRQRTLLRLCWKLARGACSFVITTITGLGFCRLPQYLNWPFSSRWRSSRWPA